MPPTRTVTIGGKPYQVSRLTLRQLLQLSAMAGVMQAEVRSRIAEAAVAGTPDFMAVASALGPIDFAKLLAILLGVHEPQDMARLGDITLEETSELAVAFTEVNDIERMVANFRKAAGNAKGLMEMGLTPSLPSSQK